MILSSKCDLSRPFYLELFLKLYETTRTTARKRFRYRAMNVEEKENKVKMPLVLVSDSFDCQEI